MDVTLKSYPLPTQTLIAIIYLSYLSEGETCNNLIVRKPTLKGYMDAVTQYSLFYVGRDICLDPDPTVPTSQW